ncbi:CaiB/BaiF CoA transferase family protein [Bailinhaonella thermotolerans]|uniref:CoA transferase n=1 Tax=Bailinhaonella thermotolerans TaxID=1070861 RepID=A0A3A4A707_9ACTN|nr:CaiB/BaiF CoA-transferase family protein [Bailinhaonella thermotolerans]RJL21683.1 CoA transferase [Bailinhaonella thermotolerans]
MSGPLAGVRVVELGIWVAGPAAACVLADWGADVVKVEAPGGDPQRAFSATLGDTAVNPTFEASNRGKRGVVLDLRSPEGAARMRDLLARADVFVTNLRVPALERLGLAYEALAGPYPRLVYALLTAHGLDGPDRDAPGYDVGSYWSRAGIAAQLAAPGGPPPMPRGGMGDRPAGMALAAAVCAALYARERGGRGQLVTTSLLRQGAFTLASDLTSVLRTGAAMPVMTRETMPNPLVNPYRAADGSWFWLLGLESGRHWPALLAALGDPPWAAGFPTPAVRATRRAELTALLDAEFARLPRAGWAERFAAAGVWWSPVQTVEEVLADPQVRASGAILGDVVAGPCDFSADVCAPGRTAPRLGQHTDEVLAELGHGETRGTGAGGSGAGGSGSGARERGPG